MRMAAKLAATSRSAATSATAHSPISATARQRDRWDRNTADDFQLPDGTVQQQPLSDQVLYGTSADAWSVTANDSLLGDNGRCCCGSDNRAGDREHGGLGAAQFTHGSVLANQT